MNKEKKFTHLTKEERYIIYEMRQNKATYQEIADKIGKSKSTICTEFNLRNRLKDYDIFCLASLEEGMAISMLEAMSMSLVPICSENTGARDVIKHGYDGFVFKIRDVKDIRKKIKI